jgi:hypothetical protein
MGFSNSRPAMSYAERERLRHEREQRARKKRDEQAKKNALKAQRDAWLRNHKIEGLEKKWWNTG